MCFIVCMNVSFITYRREQLLERVVVHVVGEGQQAGGLCVQ